jgi:glyoxylase-like metal-dependent hydrolase (beta-lactamase superfamily II)
MHIREPGKITDRVEYLGDWHSCLYLLRGKEAMIIGGGMSWVAPSLEKQLDSLHFDSARIRYLFIAHSHFDHCGAIPYLKRRFPKAQVLASAYAQKVLANPKVVEYIATRNEELIARLGLQGEQRRLKAQFDGIQVEHVVDEGETLDLGEGIEAHVLAVPGHSQCALAVYVPALKALFPTDAAPFPNEDGRRISYPSPQYDFSLYKASLKKLASLDVDLCAFEHHGVFKGAEAAKILSRGLKKAEDFEKKVLAHSRNEKELQRFIKKTAAQVLASKSFSFQNRERQEGIIDTVVKKILGSQASGVQ